MLYYCKLINNGYIDGIASSENPLTDAISKSDANHLNNMFLEKPLAPSGYTYKLRADTLEWKMVELPAVDPAEEEAGLEDYETALSEMGVDFSD